MSQRGWKWMVMIINFYTKSLINAVSGPQGEN